MEITIDKSVPLPPVRGRGKYPIREMKAGDSFAVPEGASQSLRETISQMKRREKSAKGKLFTVRKTPDGYRCWRTA